MGWMCKSGDKEGAGCVGRFKGQARSSQLSLALCQDLLIYPVTLTMVQIAEYIKVGQI